MMVTWRWCYIPSKMDIVDCDDSAMKVNEDCNINAIDDSRFAMRPFIFDNNFALHFYNPNYIFCLFYY